MTPDQIIELANQVGASKEWVISYSTIADWVFEDEQLQRFAELVGNAKLEEAAKVCDSEATCEGIAQRIAEQIRSMKK